MILHEINKCKGCATSDQFDMVVPHSHGSRCACSRRSLTKSRRRMTLLGGNSFTLVASLGRGSTRLAWRNRVRVCTLHAQRLLPNCVSDAGSQQCEGRPAHSLYRSSTPSTCSVGCAGGEDWRIMRMSVAGLVAMPSRSPRRAPASPPTAKAIT